MGDSVFRKKSLERVSSPEQLNDYIRVTGPGVWITLAAVLAIIIGFIVWGVVGKLETKVNSVAVSEEGAVVCYVKEADIEKVKTGNAVRIDGQEYAVAEISSEPTKVGQEFSEYALRVGGLTVGEWVYKLKLSGEISAGIYGASIVTDSVSPISFLFN